MAAGVGACGDDGGGTSSAELKSQLLPASEVEGTKVERTFESGTAALHLRRVDAPSKRSRHVRVPADAQGRGKFALSGLRAGRYSASLGSSGPARCVPIEFELGPEPG